MMPPTPNDARVFLGKVLRGSTAKYYIHDQLGEGGQGWVFRASWDDAEGFPVVVKVLRPDSATRDALDRFRREAEILRRLSQTNPSPFIVRFYDHGEAAFPVAMQTGESARLPFTVLEYVHGEPLHVVIDRHRHQGMGAKRARRILREVAKALEIVHAQGLIHRDLKPSNILLSNEAGREVAKVTDFGLVKVIDLRATATQSLAGVSLSYAPPEQYEPGNPRVGPWTDVFSFATIVHELLAGRAAFPSTRDNPFEALRLIATGRREPLARQSLAPELRERPDLVQRLDALLDHALAPEPGQRPQTLAALFEPVDAALREAEGRGDEHSGAFAPVPAATRPGHGAPDAITPPLGGLVGFHTGERAARTDPSDLRSWSVRVVSPGNPGASVRDAVFGDDLSEVITLGNAGLVVWRASGWSTLPLPIGLQPSDLRGLSRIGPSTLAFGGEQGLVAFLHGGAQWDVRRFPDADLVFHAVAADPSGQRVLAVGQRVSRGHAVVVEAATIGWRRTFEVPDFGPLRAVAWLDEHTAFACGDSGALVRIDDLALTRIPWERSGHLRAIAATQHPRPAVYAVGTGGHALSVGIGATGHTEIEKVTTTQDVLSVCVAPDGAPWACSANARVLRRDAMGTWRRFPQDLPYPGNLVRISARLDRVLVLGEDATLLEATL